MSESIRAKKPAVPVSRPAGVTSARQPSRSVSSGQAVPSSSRKRLWWLLSAFLLLASIGLATLAWSRRSADPQVAKVKELRKEMFGGELLKLPPAEAAKKMGAFREEVGKLSDEQRKGLFKEGFKERQKQQFEEAATYARSSPEEKQRFLDQQIDRMEEMRKQFEAMRALGGFAFGPRQGSQGGTAGAPSGQQGANPAGQPGANPPAAPSGPGPRGTPEDRLTWRKAFLDATTPEQRAHLDQLRNDLQARRTARGLQPWGFGPR